MKVRMLSILAAAWLLSPSLPAAEVERGVEILRQRQCTACHSILGAGGDRAPDLGLRRAVSWDPAAFAALLWNHGPKMWEEMALLDMEVPELPASEVGELYDYLSTLWRYDPIGVSSFGGEVWMEQQCFRCHPIVGDIQGVGSPVSRWPAVPNSVDWVRQMWNHSGLMADEFDREQGVWPVMTIQEFSDLMAYVENIETLNPPEPVISRHDLTQGQKLFREAYCEKCHTIGLNENGRVNLAPAARDKTLAELAVEMWNHAPVMSTSPFLGQVDPPRLERGEMAAVLAYVSVEAQRDLGGDPVRGRRLFDVKQCSTCHSQTGEAPPLNTHETPLSVVGFTASVWRHGPDMLDDTRLHGVTWPTLAPQDIADLLAHINQ